MYTKENNAFEKEKKMITLTTMWRPVWRTATDQVNGSDEALHSQTPPSLVEPLKANESQTGLLSLQS